MSEKEKIFKELFYNSVIFEHLCKMFETDFYRQLIENKKNEIKNINRSKISTHKKNILTKEILKEVVLNTELLKICEERKLTVSDKLQELTPSIDVEEFALENADVFIKISSILLGINSENNSEACELMPAILKKSKKKKGTKKIGDNYYEILL